MSAWKQMVTEDRGNEVHDPLRVAFIIAFGVGLALEIYSVVWQGKMFDIQAFGVGVGGLIVTTGGALWASSNQKEDGDGKSP